MEFDNRNKHIIEIIVRVDDLQTNIPQDIILIPQETIFLKTCEEKESDKPGNNESKNFELLVDMFRNERERDK